MTINLLISAAIAFLLHRQPDSSSISQAELLERLAPHEEPKPLPNGMTLEERVEALDRYMESAQSSGVIFRESDSSYWTGEKWSRDRGQARVYQFSSDMMLDIETIPQLRGAKIVREPSRRQ